VSLGSREQAVDSIRKRKIEKVKVFVKVKKGD